MEGEKPLGPMLGRAAHLSRERLDARLSKYDMTPVQAHLLLHLNRCGGQVPQCDLTEFLKVKPSTANGILDRMAEKELITRSVSGEDARRKLITITQKGRQQQRRFEKNFWEAETILTRGISAEEIAAFRALLERMIQNLEEDRATC